MSLPTPADFAYFWTLTPRWGDIDALGHVNNVKFFTYDESARLEYFQVLMKDDPKFWKDYGLILAHIEADFIAQLRELKELKIGFRIASFGRTSMKTEAAMFRDDRLIAVTRAVVVWFDYGAGKALPIPDAVRARIRALERKAPEG